MNHNLKDGDWVSAKTFEGEYIEGAVIRPTSKEEYLYVDVNWMPADDVVSQTMFQVERDSVKVVEKSDFIFNAR